MAKKLSGTFNVALGLERRYASIPDAGGAIIAVILKATGMQAPEILADHDTLSAVLAANTEANFAGYARKVYLVGDITIAVDDTNDWTTIDWADPVWAAAPASDALGKIVWAYRPASGSADTTIIPVFFSKFEVTPRGDDLRYVLAAGGIWQGRDA